MYLPILRESVVMALGILVFFSQPGMFGLYTVHLTTTSYIVLDLQPTHASLFFFVFHLLQNDFHEHARAVNQSSVITDGAITHHRRRFSFVLGNSSIIKVYSSFWCDSY